MRMGMLHGGTNFGLPSLDGVVCARKKNLGEPKQYPRVWCAGPHGRAMSLVAPMMSLWTFGPGAVFATMSFFVL